MHLSSKSMKSMKYMNNNMSNTSALPSKLMTTDRKKKAGLTFKGSSLKQQSQRSMYQL